jgi:methionyl-tRNA formyltransferase
MHTLVLGPNGDRIRPLIESACRVTQYEGHIDLEFVEANQVDFIISFGYRNIIKPPLLRMLPERIINLHISLLPWNRGYDPNLWSFLEDTPKGVSIHYVDVGIDTGDIIAQKEIFFDEATETLSTTYNKLIEAILELFDKVWPQLISKTSTRLKQQPGGSFHKASDKKRYEHLLVKGWDTPVAEIKGKALVDVNYASEMEPTLL